MRKMEELKDMLCDELDRITAEGKLTAGALDTVDKLTHSIKSIDTILAMNGYSGDYYGGNSYAMRDSRGRYSRTDMYSRDGYSMDSEDVKHDLRDIMNRTHNSRVKNAIREALREMGA